MDKFIQIGYAALRSPSGEPLEGIPLYALEKAHTEKFKSTPIEGFSQAMLNQYREYRQQCEADEKRRRQERAAKTEHKRKERVAKRVEVLKEQFLGGCDE